MKITFGRRKPRGQVLITTALLIFVLFTLALSFFKLVPIELHSALKTKQVVNAQLVADSGIQEAKVWLESQPPQKIVNQEVLDNEFNAGTDGAPIPLGETWDEGANADEIKGSWRYHVTLTENPTAPFAFDAVSTAYFNDQPVRQVRATLARENFSRYALFIDRWDSTLMMEASPGAIQGPFHTNDFFRLMVPSGFYGAGGDPFVSGTQGVMTHAGSTSEGSLPFAGSSGDGNAYYSPASPVPNSDEDVVPFDAAGALGPRYNAIVNGGRSNMSITEHVILPYSADELMVQSLGGEDAGTVSIPGEIGLYISRDGSNRVNGGIYVVGDVKVDLSINADGDQVHNYTQSIPIEAYRYTEQVDRTFPVYGNVSRTLGVGDTYYSSSTVTQTVDQQQVVGYQTESRTTTRRVQVGQRYVTGGGGTSVGSWQPVYETVTETTEVQVPIYDTVQVPRTTTVQNPITISDPTDPMIGTTVSSYEQVSTETRTVDVDRVIDKDTYEANPGAYPDAIRFYSPGPPKVATVTEVSGPSPKTIFKDYDDTVYEFNGSLNGVTFVDGSVTELKGTSKGAQHPGFADGDVFQGRYIVANPALASKGEITVTDDLLQFYDGDDSSLQGATPNTLKVGELSPNSQHALGLVSRETLLRPSSGDVLNMYAVMIAGHSIRGSEDANGIPQVEGGFGSDDDIMQPGYGINEFNLYGGLVQANQQLWHRDGNGLTGHFTYDPSVAGDMPRFPRSNRVVTLRYADRHVTTEEAI